MNNNTLKVTENFFERPHLNSNFFDALSYATDENLVKHYLDILDREISERTNNYITLKYIEYKYCVFDPDISRYLIVFKSFLSDVSELRVSQNIRITYNPHTGKFNVTNTLYTEAD